MDIEQVDGGDRVTVSVAYWRRWPQLSKVFRPVAGKKADSAVISPTGDEMKEN